MYMARVFRKDCILQMFVQAEGRKPDLQPGFSFSNFFSLLLMSIVKGEKVVQGVLEYSDTHCIEYKEVYCILQGSWSTMKETTLSTMEWFNFPSRQGSSFLPLSTMNQ